VRVRGGEERREENQNGKKAGEKRVSGRHERSVRDKGQATG
jgi:hypothetical protein